MKADPSVPAAPARLAVLRAPPRTGSKRRRPSWLRRTLVASLLIHLLLLLGVLLRPTGQALPPPPAEPATVAMVFDHGGSERKATAPNPTKNTEIPKGESDRTPEPSRAEATPPSAEPQPEQPRVNPVPPEYAMREVPPPPPSPSEPEQAFPRPSPPARPRPPRPRARDNPFAHPMQFALGPTPTRTPRGFRNSRSLDLSVGPVIRGGQIEDAVAHVRSPGAAGDYMAALSEYVESHKFYPEMAAQNGEDGTSILQVVVRRDGTVEDVRLISSAGSRWLDSAWISLFRDRKLPPFPDDMPERQRTFELSMDYELIRR